MEEIFNLNVLNSGYLTIAKKEDSETFHYVKLLKKPINKILKKSPITLNEFEEKRLKDVVLFMNSLDDSEKNFTFKIVYDNPGDIFYELTILEDEEYKFQEMKKYYEPDSHTGEIIKPSHTYNLTIYKELNSKGIIESLNNCKRIEVESILDKRNCPNSIKEQLFNIKIADYKI